MFRLTIISDDIEERKRIFNLFKDNIKLPSKIINSCFTRHTGIIRIENEESMFEIIVDSSANSMDIRGRRQSTFFNGISDEKHKEKDGGRLTNVLIAKSQIYADNYLKQFNTVKK